MYLRDAAAEPAAAAGQQPGGDTSVAALLLGTALATCGCGLVNRAAVVSRWGDAAADAWPPPSAPLLQLLLLQLLLLHGSRVIALLSSELLQALQPAWQAAGCVAMEQACGWAQLQAAEQRVQQRKASTMQLDQQHQQPDEALSVIPTAATPSFVTGEDRAAVEAHSRSAAAAAAAGAAAVIAAAAAEAQRVEAEAEQQAMQPPPGKRQKQQEQALQALAGQGQQGPQRSDASSIMVTPASGVQMSVAESAAEDARDLQLQELQALLADLTGEPEQQPWLDPGLAADSVAMQQQQWQADSLLAAGPHAASLAGEVESDGEPFLGVDTLGLDTLDLDPPQQQQLAADCEQQTSQQPQQSSQIQPGKGGRLRLVSDVQHDDAVSGRASLQAAALQLAPDASELGVVLEKPPVLPDESVVLLPETREAEQPFVT